MSLKEIDGDKIGDQKEICLQVSDYDQAIDFLTRLGCEFKAEQHTTRELWLLDNTEVTIDEWPFLEPFLEIEGKSEVAVMAASKKLGLNYESAIFGGVDVLYNLKYGIDKNIINNTRKIIFEMENPFLKN